MKKIIIAVLMLAVVMIAPLTVHAASYSYDDDSSAQVATATVDNGVVGREEFNSLKNDISGIRKDIRGMKNEYRGHRSAQKAWNKHANKRITENEKRINKHDDQFTKADDAISVLVWTMIVLMVVLVIGWLVHNNRHAIRLPAPVRERIVNMREHLREHHGQA